MTNKQNKNVKGVAAAAVMSAVIGLQFIFIKSATESFGGNVILLLFVRFLIAFALMILLSGKADKKIIFHKDVILLCLIQPCLNLLFQSYGVKAAEVSAVAYISATGPIITLLCSWLILKTKPSKKQIIQILLVCAGAILIAISRSKSGGGFNMGAVLIILSLLTRSLYAVKVKKVIAWASPLSLCFAQTVWGLIFYGACFAFTGSFKEVFLTVSALDLKSILSLLYISILSLPVVYFLNNYSLGKITVNASAILSNLTFIVTLLSGVFILGEKLTIVGAIGSVVIMAGVMIKGGENNRSKES